MKPFELCDKNMLPGIDSAEIQDNIVTQIIQRPDDEFKFLHDCMIVEFKKTLYAAWYNCPEGEMVGRSVIRGRHSNDGGKTWSGISIFVEDKTDTYMYVPPAFAVCNDSLYLLVTRMVGLDMVQDVEIFRLDEATRTFKSVMMIDIPFLPNTNAFRMSNGRLIIAGRCADIPGEMPLFPAVLISDSGRIDAPWRLVKIYPSKTLPDGVDFQFPETAVIVDGAEITAFTRNDREAAPVMFISRDCGETWSNPMTHDLPVGRAKMYAGKLSDNRRFLVSNLETSGRNKLVLFLTKKNSKMFSEYLVIRNGNDAGLDATPEWSYPAAIEYDSKLYVIYTSAKTSSALSIIPLK